jgi:hypothetical protein
MTSHLSATVLRNLSDRAYDKRKSAALEIESKVKVCALDPCLSPHLPTTGILSSLLVVLQMAETGREGMMTMRIV